MRNHAKCHQGFETFVYNVTALESLNYVEYENVFFNFERSSQQLDTTQCLQFVDFPFRYKMR